MVAYNRLDESIIYSEQLIPTQSNLQMVAFDPDGHRLVYWYFDNDGKIVLKNGFLKVVYKKKEIVREYEEGILFVNPEEAGNYRKGYTVLENPKILIDKEIVKTFTAIEKMQWNQYKNVLAMKVKLGDKYTVYINSEKGFLYDDIGEIIFSPDGKHYAYSAKLGDDWLVVIDGKEGKKYSAVKDLVYNKKSSCFVYMVQNDNRNEKYRSSKFPLNNLWGIVINDKQSEFIFANKFFTKVIFDSEYEFHLISGKYVTTTAQEKRQMYVVELKNYKLVKITDKKDEVLPK